VTASILDSPDDRVLDDLELEDLRARPTRSRGHGARRHGEEHDRGEVRRRLAAVVTTMIEPLLSAA
jgi:hypothetical protein